MRKKITRTFIVAMLLCAAMTVSAFATTQGAATLTGSDVNFRTGPGMGYSVQDCLPKGVSVAVLDRSNGDWYKVSYNGREGYISSRYLSFTQSAEVSLGSGSIKGTYVRLRSGPSLSAGILGDYNTGDRLEVTGVDGEWYKVILGGVNGYVYSQYVLLDSSSSPAQQPSGGSSEPAVTQTEQKTGYIKGNYVRFRSGASLNSKIIAEYNTGKELTITGVSGDWTQVIIDGSNGYVYSQYVTETAPAKPAYDPSGSDLGQQIADYAMQFLGYNYVYGGSSPATGFDCSGLMYYVYGQFGYKIERVAANQAYCGEHVDYEDLQPGDIICFYSTDYSYIGHVGMYIGNGQFIHASTYNTGVIISNLGSGSYDSRYYDARRII